MFFYLLFGLFLLARPRIRLIGLLAVLAGLVAVGRLFALPPTTIAGFYTSDMLLEFGLGVALGALASHGPGLTGVSRMWSWVMLGTGAVALASLPLVAELSGFVMRGIPAGLIVAGLLVIEAHSGLFRSRLLHGLGDASYSIYLSHMISLAASSQLWRVMALPQDAGGLCLYMVFAVLLSLAGGWLLHLLVERPFNRRLRGATPKRAQIIRTQGDA
jgi:exopolysaccharide production protein ExoZ